MGTGGDVILGVSCDYHDAAAALVADGEVVAAAEEERFTRIKHDPSLPRRAVAACLKTARLAADDVDHIVFYEKPMLVASRYLTSRQRIGPRGLRGFVEDVPRLVGRNLLVGYRLRRLLMDLGASHPPVVQYVEHHRSHASAAFHPSPFDSAAILTVDGIGEWATATVGHGVLHKVSVLEEQRYPNSLGLLYSFITAWCGFTPNDGEYKLMGLAPYGQPTFDDALAEIAELHDDGSLTVDARRLEWYGRRAFRRKDLHDLLGGPPRSAGASFTRREADLAASLQQLTETAMLNAARRAHELTGEDALCLAGGVALNCVANGRILRDGPFERIWVQPAAGDAGSAIGAALTYWHDELGHHRTHGAQRNSDSMSGALLGPEIDPAEVESELRRADVPFEVPESEQDLVDEVARYLAEGRVVGWFRGRMEFGPRALGNRSILADPRDPTLRTRLNELVKGRESFRPFAPAVMAEHVEDWFELEHESPYMLIVAPVREVHLRRVECEPTSFHERAAVARSTVPACTHVDGSARIQTVTRDSNPRFHALLEAFRDLTDCPMVVNTSFNMAGEPIVASVGDAVSTARRGGLDLLVIEHVLVRGTALNNATEGAIDEVVT